MAVYSSSGGSFKPGVVKGVLCTIGVCMIFYILGPPLYWHLTEAVAAITHSSSSSSGGSNCPPCNCDCDAQPLLSIPQELSNSSFAGQFSFRKKRNTLASIFEHFSSTIDCVKHDPEVSDDMDKNFTDLLSEELKLKEAEALEKQRRSDMALLEAKKMASQFQKEADKCNSGMGTCEEAREKAEAALLAQKRLSEMWELRARQRGWKEGPAR